MKYLPALFALALAIVSPRAEALTCYALTSDNHLITFDSSTPATATNVNLTMPNVAYSVVGIDIRTTTQPTNAANAGVGSLWGIAFNGTTSFRLCVINPTTGVVTFVGGVLVMDDSANADAFGFGFDPATDRFRFISVQNNYQIDPNTVTVTKQTDITFPTAFPAQSGAAFTTTSYGGTNQFYNIGRNGTRTLQISNNISAGTLAEINPNGLSPNLDAPMGMAISGSLFLLVNSNDIHLYSINRTAGTKSDLGPIGGGAPGFRGLAIRPASYPAPFTVTVAIKGKKKITTTKTSLKIKGTASCGAGITKVQYKAGKGGFKTATGTTSWSFKAKKLKIGTNKIQVKAIGGNGVVSSIAKIKVIVKNTTTTTN